MAVLGGAIVYIFFILPGKAITEATNRIEEDISQVITNLSEQTDANLVKFGQAKEKLKILNQGLKESNERFKSVKENIDEIEKSDLDEAAGFLRALRDNKKIANIIPRIDQLEEKTESFVRATKIINITYVSKLGPNDG